MVTAGTRACLFFSARVPSAAGTWRNPNDFACSATRILAPHESAYPAVVAAFQAARVDMPVAGKSGQ